MSRLVDSVATSKSEIRDFDFRVYCCAFELHGLSCRWSFRRCDGERAVRWLPNMSFGCEGDWRGEYPSEFVIDPTGPASGNSRVLRGGSWWNGARYLRAARRDENEPGTRNGVVGFRLARGL